MIELFDERAPSDELLTRDRTQAFGYVWLGAASIERGDVSGGMEHAVAAVRGSIIDLSEEHSSSNPDLFATI